MNYQDTIDYWNEVFSNVQEYDLAKPISFEQIENALKWLCKDSTSILDFGCGHGKILFRCLGLGVKKVYGIDISSAAISFAKKLKRSINWIIASLCVVVLMNYMIFLIVNLMQ